MNKVNLYQELYDIDKDLPKNFKKNLLNFNQDYTWVEEIKKLFKNPKNIAQSDHDTPIDSFTWSETKEQDTWLDLDILFSNKYNLSETEFYWKPKPVMYKLKQY